MHSNRKDKDKRNPNSLGLKSILSFAIVIMLLSSPLLSFTPFANGEDAAPSSKNSSGSNFTSSDSTDPATNATSSDQADQSSGSNGTSTNNTSSDQAQNATGSSNTTTTVIAQEVGNETNSEAEVESAASAGRVTISGEPLVPADHGMSRDFSYPMLAFEGEIISEIRVTLVWEPDGTVTVKDNRGYEFSLARPESDGTVSLYANSTTIDQRVVSPGLMYDIYWNPAENSDGYVDSYKFIIAGVNENATAIELDFVDRDSVRFGLVEESRFTVTQSDSPEIKDGESQSTDRSLNLDSEGVGVALPGGPSVGRDFIPEEEPEGLMLDWSDVVDSGHAARFDAMRSSLIISLDAGPFFLDPQVVASISGSISPGKNLAFQDQLRLFTTSNGTDARLQAFYYNGSNILYKTSDDEGDTWSSAISLSTGTIAANNNRWSITPSTAANGTEYVHLFYWTKSGSTTTIKTKRGVVDDLDINWGSVVQIGTITSNESCSPGACVSVTTTSDSNGAVYAAFIWNTTGGSFSLIIKKSTDSGLSWSDSLSQINGIASNILIMTLTPLDYPKMLFVYAKHENATLFYRVYNGSTWGSEQSITSNGLTTFTRKQMSSIYHAGDGMAYVAYTNVTASAGGILKLAKFFGNGTFDGLETVDSTLRHYIPNIIPTDSGGISINSIANNKIYNIRKTGGTWGNPYNPYGISFNSPDELTATNVLGGQIGAVWKEKTSSPFDIEFESEPPRIEWDPSTINAQTAILMPLQLNFTSTQVISEATVNASSSITDLVIFQNTTLVDIPPDQRQTLPIELIIPPNVTSGWYNGTITMYRHGIEIPDPLPLNILVPTLYSETVEVANGTVTKISTPSLSPFFNNTYDAIVYFTFPNGTDIVIDYYFDVFATNATEQLSSSQSPALVILSPFTAISDYFTSLIKDISRLWPWQMSEAYAQSAEVVVLDRCTEYSIKYSQDYRSRDQSYINDDITVAGDALNVDTVQHPLIVRTDVRWDQVDTGHFDGDTGEWVHNFTNLETVITDTFEKLIITGVEENSNNRAYIVLATSEPPEDIKKKAPGLFPLFSQPTGVPVDQTFAQFLYKDEANTFINQTINKIIDLGYGNKVAYWQIDNEPTHHPARTVEVISTSPFMMAVFTDWQKTSEALNLWLDTVETLDPATPRIINVNQASEKHFIPEEMEETGFVFTLTPFVNLLRADLSGDLGEEIASKMTVMGFDIYPDQWVNMVGTDAGDIAQAYTDSLEKLKEQYDIAKDDYSFSGRWGIAELAAGPKQPIPFFGGYLTDVLNPEDVSEMIDLALENEFMSDDTPAIISLFQLRSLNSGGLSWIWPFHHAYGIITDSSLAGSVNTDFLDAIDSSVEQDCGIYLGHDVEVNGDSVYVAWSDSIEIEDDLSGAILFRKSTDAGASFGDTVTLSATETPAYPQIAVSGSNVYAVWHDATDGDVYFSRSTNAGSSFNSPVNLSSDADSSEFPKIIAAGNDVYVTWQGDKLIFVKSSNSGSSFGSTVNIGTGTAGIEDSQMRKDGSKLYFAWRSSSGTHDVFFRRSIDSGITFNATISLNAAGFAIGSGISIASSGSNVYVAYSETPGTQEHNEVYFVNSTDSGESFDDPVDLSSTVDSTSNYPKIDASGDIIHLVWLEEEEIEYRNSTDNGNTWSDAIELITPLEGQPAEPIMAYSAPYLYISTGNEEILLVTSSDDGDTFSSVINVSNTPYGPSFSPVMAADADTLYMVHVDTFGSPSYPMRELYFRVID